MEMNFSQLQITVASVIRRIYFSSSRHTQLFFEMNLQVPHKLLIFLSFSLHTHITTMHMPNIF